MDYPGQLEAKAMLCEYGRRLYDKGFTAGREGNLSCRTGENVVWVTPTMESKGYMDPDMMVKLDLDGNKLEDGYSPSSESKLHLGLYRENSSITAVIHTHPPFATALACCGKNVPTTSMAESIMLFGKELIVTPYATPGTLNVPESVRQYANDHRALLLGNHGALTWAPTMKEAWFYMEMLEQFCKTYLISDRLIGGVKPLPDNDVEMWDSYLKTQAE